MPNSYLHPTEIELTLNNYFSISSHNSFEVTNAVKIEDVLVCSNSIELDIWDSEIGSGFISNLLGGKRMEFDWFVKHQAWDKSDNNCCGGTFRNCLLRIKKWCELNPSHNFLTIFIDKKENWSNSNETRRPSDLDTLLVSIFEYSTIFSPKQILIANSSLKEFVATSGWPTLGFLKGKIMFVITDASIQKITKRAPLNEYLEERGKEAICFVAPEISSAGEISDPSKISMSNKENVVFFNLNYKDRNLANEIWPMNFLTRVYSAPEVKETYDRLLTQKINYIAMNNYKLDI